MSVRNLRYIMCQPLDWFEHGQEASQRPLARKSDARVVQVAFHSARKLLFVLWKVPGESLLVSYHVRTDSDEQWVLTYRAKLILPRQPKNIQVSDHLVVVQAANNGPAVICSHQLQPLQLPLGIEHFESCNIFLTTDCILVERNRHADLVVFDLRSVVPSLESQLCKKAATSSKRVKRVNKPRCQKIILPKPITITKKCLLPGTTLDSMDLLTFNDNLMLFTKTNYHAAAEELRSLFYVISYPNF